jgi:hypothetical protein
MVKLTPFKGGSRVAVNREPRSYSDHDTQECGIACTDRDDIDDGSPIVDVRHHLPQRAAGLGPLVTLFQSFIYAFGCFSVAVFLYLFHRAQ